MKKSTSSSKQFHLFHLQCDCYRARGILIVMRDNVATEWGWTECNYGNVVEITLTHSEEEDY